MGKTVIIKVGKTFESLLPGEGDFEHWILTGMGMDRERAHIVDVCEGAPLPDYDAISGVVITGSHEMVTEQLDWSERTAAWLPGVVERKIPVLGICYGHQLLAYAMGGKVGDNPMGRHFGTVNVDLAPGAGEDLLFRDLPNPVRFHVCHTQCVLELPPDALLLASNDKDHHQAFVLGDSAWGIQFHPEFNRTILRAYIETYREDLREEGQNPDQLIKESTETPSGTEFLRRFAEIVEARETWKGRGDRQP